MVLCLPYHLIFNPT